MEIGLFETLPGFGGGNIYQKNIVRALQATCRVRVFRVDAHPLLGIRLGKSWQSARILQMCPEIDIWICTYLPTIALNLFRPHAKIISLFYHWDKSTLPYPIISTLLHRLYCRQAFRCDAVVVIAEYWRNHLERRNVDVTDLIHWGFDVSFFRFSEEEIRAFKVRHDLLDKPIIYLGNCRKDKGVVEAYEQLKDFGAHLVTSGEEKVQIPAQNLKLSYKEYCLLLRASDVVLTMSKFKEGWNATAHEAMLARTPVIGSGLGGMGELLANGNQIVCQNISDLPSKVRYAMDHAQELGERGFCYASKFTSKRFKSSWLGLVDRLAN